MLRAIDITPVRITDASAGFVAIPVSVVEGLGFSIKSIRGVIIPSRGIAKVLDILASAMSRAIIGAGAALASLAFIAVEASALTRVTLADTTTSTLHILVEVSIDIREVNPCDLIGADSLRAVRGVVAETHAPVVVAHAHVVSGAAAVA
jgi:hypothetical protein